MSEIIETSAGLLRGKKLKSVRNVDYLSFQGIPYAKPPVGDLRFRPPQPLEKWEGVRDALEEGPPAPGFHIVSLKYLEKSSEDCLYLNVYTPKVERPLKPVLFWIHGGAFHSDSGGTDNYGPDYLMAENIVLVTCNFRLGPLGFLSLQTAECPGNNGLKDQIAALKWVQKNICAFGGDPNNVTIFGQSSGGVSVHFLILSKLAKGLFHKAVAQSGVSLNPIALAAKPREKAFILGELLGCKTKDEKELLNFLKSLDAKKIITATVKVKKLIEPNELFIRMAFQPTVEPDLEGAVISKHPAEILESQDFNKVPFLVGFNTLEGLIFLTPNKQINYLDFEKDLPKLLPNELGMNVETKKGQEILNEIRKFYFPSGFVDQNFVNALSFTYFLKGMYEAIEYHAKTGSPTFVYQFNYDGEIGLKTAYDCTRLKGIGHGDELRYLFKSKSKRKDLKPGSSDYLMMEKMTKIWADFAKNGKPLPDWKPCTDFREFYMEIGQKLTLRENLDKTEFNFWKKMYKMALQDKSKL